MIDIKLRDIRVDERASEETYSYSAILVVDGKDMALVGNSGRGGCDRVLRVFPPFTLKDVDKLSLRVPKEYPLLDMSAYGMEDIPTSLDTVCATLVEDFLEAKRKG